MPNKTKINENQFTSRCVLVFTRKQRGANGAVCVNPLFTPE